MQQRYYRQLLETNSKAIPEVHLNVTQVQYLLPIELLNCQFRHVPLLVWSPCCSTLHTTGKAN